MTPLEREFTTFLKHLGLEQGWFAIKPMTKENISEYGEQAVDGTIFGGYTVIKYKHTYEVHSIGGLRYRDGFLHEVFVMSYEPGDRETPPDQEEVYLFGHELSSKTFLEILNHMNEARLTDALMCDDMVPQHPYVVNYILDGVKGQYVCEGPDTQSAIEQCSDCYPGCEIEFILIQGEE